VEPEIRRGEIADIERLAPLWTAMWKHHATLPELPEMRELEASWRMRTEQYREWLADDEHALLLAERDGEPVGYAMVSVGGGAPSWGGLGDRTAEIETLSVLESERGAGVGAELTQAAIDFARERGAGSILVAAAHSNEGALSFYRREGFEDFYVLLSRPIDRED
jgi:ribosomal protein S18 acetylase RimI-like enzyme